MSLNLYHETDTPAVTLKLLFPLSLYRAAGFSQNDCLNLLPPALLSMEDGELLSSKTKGRISKYWNADPASRRDAERVKNNLLNLASDATYTFFTLGAIQLLKENISHFLTKLPQTDRNDYEAFINSLTQCLLHGIDTNVKIYQGLKNYRLETVFHKDLPDLPSRLTCLTLIAATWIFWDHAASGTDPESLAASGALSLIIFPYHRNNEAAGLSADDRESLCQAEQEKSKTAAKEKLGRAQSFFRERNYLECGKRCREIISMGFADPDVKGTAYYLLVKCHDNYNYTYNGYYNASEFIRQAISLGCAEARDEWRTLHLDSLLHCTRPSESAPSRLVFNCTAHNKRAEAYLKTLPDSMAFQTPFQHYISFPNEHKTLDFRHALAETLSPRTDIRYLLFDDDADKNFHDMLFLLDRIKNWNAPSRNRTSAACPDDWKGIEIYLCADTDRYSALIDTALRHMDGIIIRIFLIDDALWSAQYLLSRHPVFYPIRSLRAERLKQESKPYILNLNLLSVNDTLANRLIREAFWMSCFLYRALTVNINIFSPDAEAIEKRLRYDCKGMFQSNLPDSDRISAIHINTYPVRDGFYSETLFSQYLDSCCCSTKHSSFQYFILNTGSDIDNLNLGIKLREWSIRDIIHSGLTPGKAEPPVITYFCEDPDTAHLAESMVVQLEEHGDSWYNNYALIPFGMLTDHYSYDSLSNGYFEKAALSTHLQYCGIEPNAPSGTRDAVSDYAHRRHDAMNQYYSRWYNRDSSMAAALSLPYRLFQSKTDAGLEHILPTGWNITNPEAFTASASILEMGTAFQKLGNLDELIRYEHARWARWMISRGWVPASLDESIRYMKAGNPGRQLYIGRMHPCICSFDALASLSARIEPFESAQNSQFTAINKSNLLQTRDIVETRWFSSCANRSK